MYGGRSQFVDIPLFPGYLFLSGGEHERYTTLMTHRAVQVIQVVDQERLKTELRHVYRAISSGRPVELYPGIQRGRRCRVVRGPLAGIEGIVLRRRDTWRVYLGVEILGQSAEVEVDPSSLEIIG